LNRIVVEGEIEIETVASVDSDLNAVYQYLIGSEGEQYERCNRSGSNTARCNRPALASLASPGGCDYAARNKAEPLWKARDVNLSAGCVASADNVMLALFGRNAPGRKRLLTATATLLAKHNATKRTNEGSCDCSVVFAGLFEGLIVRP